MSGDEEGPPAAVFAPPVPEPFPPPPPDRPARMVIHEYSWPAAAPPYGRAFTIVLKDGRVMRAAAVWRTDDALNFTGADGGGGRLMLNSIDIEATRTLNAQAGLVWPSTLR